MSSEPQEKSNEEAKPENSQTEDRKPSIPIISLLNFDPETRERGFINRY
jgi:hypothetical protein